MTLVVIDTNAVHRDPWMKNVPGQELLAHASRGECKVVFPHVVLDELLRQQHDWVQDNHGAITRVVDRMRGNPIDVSGTANELKRSFDGLWKQIDKSFDALKAHSGVEVAPIPVAHDLTARLVARDLARKRPFLEVGSEGWSAGYRDAVIWETVLECLGWLEDDEKLIFVTADKGFLTDDKKTFHADLLDDLDSRAFARGRVVSAQTTARALAEVQAVVEHAARTREMVEVATNELFSLDGKDVSMQMVYGGDYDYPDFVKFQMPSLESAMIAAIDQNTSWVFEEDAYGLVSGTSDVVLAIQGAVEKSAWLQDDEGVFEIYDDLNDWYFGVGATIFARAVVEIDVSDGPGQYRVTSIVLADEPSDPNVTTDLSNFENPTTSQFDSEPEHAATSGGEQRPAL
ncbi:PIN domain-containing protein [Microbacterium sp. RG1]|uniref:PIN domain-containing protein n=1 Tax=Microbacterium sp. RG1 TaxID=2489212 RepID=UPI0010CA21A0|nr:PIN domain-containing protein [Microbacterium sp. RG1]QCQ15845.1 DUF4935 domain-containing protein [Microbacterium sp. RG1]